MINVLKIFCVTALLLCMAGCAPMYETHYQYQPPTSQAGQKGVSKCLIQKNMCQQMCQMREDTCVARAKQEALYNFELYKEERRVANQTVEKTLTSFDTSNLCRNDCGCDENYMQCFQNYGGVINENKVCVAFCDNQ